MKKITLYFVLIMILCSLTGCVQDAVSKVEEGKNKVEYYTKMTSLVLSTTNATLQLHVLYQNPLEYGTSDWKADFYHNKEILEDNHEQVTALTPPSEVQEAHDGFVSALELTMEANNAVDIAIQKGEELTEGVSEQIDEAINVYQSFTEILNQFSN